VNSDYGMAYPLLFTTHHSRYSLFGGRNR